MPNSKISQRQKGVGDLVLKDDISKAVEWEIDRYTDGSLGKGHIRGDVEHLATAAQDGWATLRLSPDEAAAVSIDTCTDGEASFTTMVPLVTPVVFEAASIVSYSLNSDDTLFSIEYRSPHADHLLVSLPTETMRNYLPLLQASYACSFVGRRNDFVFCHLSAMGNGDDRGSAFSVHQIRRWSTDGLLAAASPPSCCGIDRTSKGGGVPLKAVHGHSVRGHPAARQRGGIFHVAGHHRPA
jgi:hypothetical protein